MRKIGIFSIKTKICRGRISSKTGVNFNGLLWSTKIFEFFRKEFDVAEITPPLEKLKKRNKVR